MNILKFYSRMFESIPKVILGNISRLMICSAVRGIKVLRMVCGYVMS